MAQPKKKATPKKPRADKYDEKLAIKGTFADTFKVVRKNKEEKLKKQSQIQIEFQDGGWAYVGHITVIKNRKSEGQLKLSILFDTPESMYVDFTYAFLGLKHRLTPTSASPNFNSSLIPSIEKALRNHPDFPFTKS